MAVLTLKEADFQKAIIDLARRLGWRVAHFRVSQTDERWMTPVAADGKGFPDLVLVRERIVWIEVKAEKGRVRPDQVEWIDALRNAGAEVHIWRPSQWTLIEGVLGAAA